MNSLIKHRVAVTSRSFSKNPVLRQALLDNYPDAKFNDDGVSLTGDSLVCFLDGCEKAITALEKIDGELLSKLPNLKVIGKYGVGLDMIDLNAMDKYGVKLGWTGGINKRSVSELVIAFAISLLHRIPFASQEVKNGKWYQVKGRQLTGCTFGVVGCGHIGKDVIRILQPFNCKILSYDCLGFPSFYKEYNVKAVGLKELLNSSDVVTLHLPLNDSTRYIIDSEMLDCIKNKSVIINLARGGLIDERALKEKLLNGKLSGAALDVFNEEPPTDFELISLDNVLVTPHIGGSTEEAIIAMGLAAINGLDNSTNPLDYR
jgi:phosphoglycerate dehydrogenase-like enzyme